MKRQIYDFFSKRSGSIVSQVAKFILTGFFTAGIDFLILILLVEVFFLHYFVASAFSFLVGVLLNYYISRGWVFGHGRFQYKYECMGFFIMSTLGLVINQIILLLFVGYCSVDYRFSKIISVCVVSSWNFITKKYIVFRR